MSGGNELMQILQLFEALLPLDEAGRKRCLASHPGLSESIIRQTVLILRADEDVHPLPRLEILLSALGHLGN